MKELGTQPIPKLLLRYAVPAVIAMTASSLYNIVDRIFIGHIGTGSEGALALSGLAVTFPIMNLSAAFGAMVGVGGSTLMSVKLGQRDELMARRVFGNVVTLNIIIGLLIMVAGIAAINPLLYFFGASSNTLEYGRQYMFIILLGNTITHLYFGLNAALRATGHPSRAMTATIATVVANSLLDPLFIFVFDMGIQGAAIATILSQAIALAYICYLFSRKSQPVHFTKGIYRPNGRIVRNMLTIGLSPFAMQMCACLVVILINQGLQRHGGDLAIAAYGIVNGITFLFVMVVLGITQGMQPIAGYNYGAHNFDRVTQVLRASIIYATIVMILSFLICQLLPHLPVRLFTSDPALTRLSIDGMRIITLIHPLVGFQIVTGNFFQSIGMARQSIFLSVSRQMIFLVPFLLILPGIYGTNGVWASIAASDAVSVITAAAMLWYFYRTGGINKTQIDL